MYESEKYFIVPQASILMLEREEDYNGGLSFMPFGLEKNTSS